MLYKLTVKCPTCCKIVIWQNKNPYRPFCNKHCKLIDFMGWINEEKMISSQKNTSEIDD